jgi:ABC-2 type transport system permease protein
MSPSRVGAIILRQAYLMRSSPQRVIPLIGWVAIDMVLWGFMSRYLNGLHNPGFSFTRTLLGAVLLWDFMTRVMQGVSMAFFEDVWSRSFLNFFAAPLTLAEYLTGLVATGVATSLVGLVVMIALATSAFGLSFADYGPALVPYVVVLFLSGIALGITSVAVVMRLGPAAEWLIWPIPSVLAPFAAVYYPLHVVPGWMQAIARLLPPSYVFEGVRAQAHGQSPAWGGLALGGALAAGYVVLACLFFASVYRYAIRTGLLARYTAESVS